MATILYAWELGGGQGHVGPMVPVAEALTCRGHKFFAALRDVAHCGRALRGRSMHLLAAPFRESRGREGFRPPLTYAHILHNTGFGNAFDLDALAGAWRTIFELVHPDLILFDHSPTALLASRGAPYRRAIFGSGFFCPPDIQPLPHLLRAWSKPEPGQLEADEQSVLNRVNDFLDRNHQSPMVRLSQLYSQVDENFLMTYEELDHFGPRPGARYWGTNPSPGKADPVWPDGGGSRVYAYLKNFAAMPALMEILRKSGLATIVVADGIDPAIQQKHACQTLRFEPRLLDIPKVMAQCDLVICNAGHGVLTAALLAGKPCLLFPIFMEQYLLAKKAERLGAALLANVDDAKTIAPALQAMLGSAQYGRRARQFAERYARTDPIDALTSLVDRIEQLCESHPRSMATAAP